MELTFYAENIQLGAPSSTDDRCAFRLSFTAKMLPSENQEWARQQAADEVARKLRERDRAVGSLLAIQRHHLVPALERDPENEHVWSIAAECGRGLGEK